MMTISGALEAYKICTEAEGKSTQTIHWITASMGYFKEFLGGDRDVREISANDLRLFIVDRLQRHRWENRPDVGPQKQTLSRQSVQTYARAIGAFFGFLKREEILETNPMEKVKVPKVPDNLKGILPFVCTGWPEYLLEPSEDFSMFDGTLHRKRDH